MTPKILKAGLLVGALVFALVSCGQNSKPETTNTLPKTLPLAYNGSKDFEIAKIITDKDNDSFTFSNFWSQDPGVASIGLRPAKNPKYIVVTAGHMPGTAKVSFNVSDGTDTITVEITVRVGAAPVPDPVCGLTDASTRDACPDGSVYDPLEVDIEDHDTNTDYEFIFLLSSLITATNAAAPNYQVGEITTDEYLGTLAVVRLDDSGDSPVLDNSDGTYYLDINLGSNPETTPVGVTAIVELEAATDVGPVHVHFVVIDSDTTN